MKSFDDILTYNFALGSTYLLLPMTYLLLFSMEMFSNSGPLATSNSNVLIALILLLHAYISVILLLAHKTLTRRKEYASATTSSGSILPLHTSGVGSESIEWYAISTSRRSMPPYDGTRAGQEETYRWDNQSEHLVDNPWVDG
jgi:hypothetical protein